MRKTLYSLILDEDVVKEVDALAHRLGTNRSNLINEILAEYVDFTTPEKRINDILSSIHSIMQPDRDLVSFFAPHTYSLSLKSSLEYKYRPTIKYEIELFKTRSDKIGELSVLFRTQSPALIQNMTDFFNLWISVEKAHLVPLMGHNIDYALYDGKFVRSVSSPDKSCTADDLAAAFAEYIRLFDRLMKGYITGKFDARAIETAYYSFIRNLPVHF